MKTQPEKKDCDCLEKTAELIKKQVTEDERQKGFKIIEADWEHKSWFPKVRIYANYIIKSTFEKKDGTTSKPQKSHVNIFFTYCPFCGEKFNTMNK